MMATMKLGNVSSQNHLQGSYSLLASRHVHLTADLLSAGYWNYLREDITVALIEKRGLMITLSDQNAPPEATEDMDFANSVTFILGKLINRCLSVDSSPLGVMEWEAMKAELDRWKSFLPPSFDPIETPGLRTPSSFPPIWTLRSWHGWTPSQERFAFPADVTSIDSSLLPYRHGHSLAGPAGTSALESIAAHRRYGLLASETRLPCYRGLCFGGFK